MVPGDRIATGVYFDLVCRWPQDRVAEDGQKLGQKHRPLREVCKGRGRTEPKVKNAANKFPLPPVAWTVAGCGTLVAESPCRSSGKFQCRLEIPPVAVRIKREGHHAPEVAG